MRTIFLPDLNLKSLNQTLTIVGDDAFHLGNVLRCKINDKVQITDGQGSGLLCTIKVINKGSILLDIENNFQKDRTHQFSLLCGKPKKATCEDIVRLAAELGLKKVFFWESEFSQPGNISTERLNTILKNSMEQSNNYWLPKIEFISNVSADLLEEFSEVVVLHNHNTEEAKTKNNLSQQNILLVVGPEGGLNSKDLDHLVNIKKNCRLVNFPTPIMTTPTAISFGFGFLMNTFLNDVK